jgi:hypothetical protein
MSGTTFDWPVVGRCSTTWTNAFRIYADLVGAVGAADRLPQHGDVPVVEAARRVAGNSVALGQSFQGAAATSVAQVWSATSAT